MAIFDPRLKRASLGFTTESVVLRALQEQLVENGGSYLPYRCSDGQSKEADLVVVANGTFSSFRKKLGKELDPEYLGFKVYRGMSLDPTLPQTPFQTWGPGGRFASVPIEGGNAWFYAVSSSPKKAHVKEATCLTRVRQDVEDWHDPIRSLLDSTDPSSLRVDDAMTSSDVGEYIMQESALFDGKKNLHSSMVFIGDAAHTIDPILAQGACVAIEDASVLAKCITNSLQLVSGPNGIEKRVSIPTAIGSFYRNRTRRIDGLQAASSLSYFFGHIDSALLCAVRDWVLKMTPGFLKRRTSLFSLSTHTHILLHFAVTRLPYSSTTYVCMRLPHNVICDIAHAVYLYSYLCLPSSVFTSKGAIFDSMITQSLAQDGGWIARAKPLLKYT
jgi:2-polyprenyl-6-methoxyphenol hydroxylase-like FAD-dependent oxidoreductase